MEKISFYGQKVILQFMVFFLCFVLMIGSGLFAYFFLTLGDFLAGIICLLLTIIFLTLSVLSVRRLLVTMKRTK